MSIEMLIDAEAAAEILHLHPKTVKRFAAAGTIPALKLGKLWRFRASSLDDWAKAQLDSACHPFHQKEVER
jgi:excisionase family DNA binding protein